MSSYERSKGTSRLPSWRSNEPPAGQPEDFRMRGPVIRPSDFIRQPQPEPVADPFERVEETIPPPPPEPSPVRVKKEVRAKEEEERAPAPRAEEAVRERPVPPAAAGPILDLRSAVRAIWARRLLILILAAVGGVLGAAVIPLLPQKFTAETSLYFDPRQVGTSDSSQATVAPELISALIDSQTQILSSGKVLGRVIDALKLDQDPQFNGGASGDTAKYIATATLQKALLIAREAST